MDDGSDDAGIQNFLREPSQRPSYTSYQPLDQEHNQIRLLRIWFGPGTDDIHGKLEHVDLKSGTRYEALSYYWGPPDKQQIIIIDGQKVFIRKSLHIFLRTLCTNGQTLPVWLDTVCINQADVDERNWQVSIMHDIYRNASCVKAWLGESTVDSEYAFDYIKYCRSRQLHACEHLRTIQRHARHAFWQLASRPYWSRVWIVQEVAQAQQLTVMCGSRSVQWSALVDASEELFGNVLENVIYGLHRAYREDDTTRECFGRLERLRSITRGTESVDVLLIEEAVAEFAHHNCEDPRDKIYGLRSIVYGGDKLAVDYRKPLAEVYFDMLSASLRTSLGRELTSRRPFHEFANDARYILEWLAISDGDIADSLLFESSQLHHSFHNMSEFSSYWWMRDLIHRRSQYTFCPALPEDWPMVGDLFYELDILDSLKPFRIVLRIEDYDSIRIVGTMIGPGDDNHPTDAAFKDKRAKALSVMSFMIRGGMQLCYKRRSHTDLSVHYSRATLLAAIVNDYDPSHHLARWSKVESPRTRSAFRGNSTLPQLCKCDVYPTNADRHRTLVEIMSYHSSEARRRFTEPELRLLQTSLPIKHGVINTLSYQSIRAGRDGLSSIPQLRPFDLSMRYGRQRVEIPDKVGTEPAQMSTPVREHFMDF